VIGSIETSNKEGGGRNENGVKSNRVGGGLYLKGCGVWMGAGFQNI
jgi:hypothetical protein